MIDFLIALAGVAIAFVALMPVLKTGGQAIAAFMRRTHVLLYILATAAQLAGLFAAALIAVAASQGKSDLLTRLIAAGLLLACIYAVNWIIHRTLLKNIQ